MKKISVWTAASIVVANMIGTGVFTSVGFQLSAVQNTWSIILLWVGGGILSLFGAFAYASRGLTWASLGAELLADLIEGVPQALDADLADAVDPSRFLLRELRRRPVRQEPSSP